MGFLSGTENMTLVFVCLGYLTQYSIFYFHPLTYNFIISFFLLHTTFPLFIHLLRKGMLFTFYSYGEESGNEYS